MTIINPQNEIIGVVKSRNCVVQENEKYMYNTVEFQYFAHRWFKARR